MTASLAVFFALAALAVIGAVSLIVQKHPIHSALSLIVVMIALAGLYLLLGAEFVAAVQIIVYGGAIMVLFVFVIMLLNAGVEEHTSISKMAGAPGLLLVVALAGCGGGSTRPPVGPVPDGGLFTAVIAPMVFNTVLEYPLLVAALPFFRAVKSGNDRWRIPVLFGLGVLAFIFKRNIITIVMSIELMLNAVNLAFVAFSQALGKLDGQVFVLFVIVVAAAEAAVGLGIIILIARSRQTLNVERVDLLKL